MNDDWFEVLTALLDTQARFLVIGAHAMAVHGIPRGTQDLDLWIEPTASNAALVWTALVRFGAPLKALGVTRDDFVRADTVVQVGLPPNRIDLLTSVSGLDSFAAAWADRVEHPVRDRRVPFLSRNDLRANKRAAGRLKDLADLEALGDAG